MASITKTPTATATNTLVCVKATMSTSAGIFLGDKPLRTTVPLLLAQIITIFVTTRITHAVLRHLGQPQVVSYVVAGIILGPSFLSRNETFKNLLFPMSSWVHLNMIALLAFLLFIFVIGVKTDLGVIQKSGKKAVVIANVGALLPFGAVMLVGHLLRDSLPPSFRINNFVAQVAGRWAVTSNTVLICLLNEFNLLTSKLGRLATSASLITDFINLILTSVGVAWSLSMEMKSAMVGVGSFITFAGFIAVIMFGARPLVLWMIRRTPEGGPMDEAYFMTVLLLALGLGLGGELIGQHATVGPLLLGLILPGGPPLGTTLSERLDRLVSGLFLPLYLVIIGFRTDIWEVAAGGEAVDYMALFIVASTVAKLAGALLPCLFCNMPFRDALVLTLMMSCKGIMEINTFSAWDESHLFPHNMYSLSVLAALVVGGSTAALLKHLYKPSMRFLAYKRRTIEHSRCKDELRVLVCVHHALNVLPILALLEISHPTHDSPICAYLLHLTPLTGHAASVLAPYKLRKRRRGSFKSDTSSSESDHIVNAFRSLERHSAGRLFVLPYVGIAPYATMHDDVCSIALEKKVSIVVLPFHKHVEIGGSVESVNPAVRAMNVKVLTYAPCSVAILVDHGLFGGPPGPNPNPIRRVAVFFLGGADDRESLAYAARMADSPIVGLTVVRFRLPEEMIGGDVSREELLDEEAVGEFRVECAGNGRVEYREEVVREAAGTVAVIREMCEDYDLLIVGRRHGMESPLTAGLETWSEYPELGVIGDVLASTDFGGKVSTLVVQQQTRVGAVPAEEDSSRRTAGYGSNVNPVGDDHESEEPGNGFDSSRELWVKGDQWAGPI